MTVIQSKLALSAETSLRNRDHMLTLVGRLKSFEERTRSESQKAAALFASRGQMLPRERISHLLDAGAPWLELATLAGLGVEESDAHKSAPGAGVIVGVGYVARVRCMIVASDAGINAGAIGAMGMEKIARAQEIALRNKLPFLHLVESAGANLMKYKVATFVQGGCIFRNLVRLSAAGVPVVTIVHGSSTAGGAYFPGLSDYVIMVRGRARAFLAGPPLLRAATGEIATEEELGGAQMHASISGLAEYLAENDADAIRIARDVVSRLNWSCDLMPRGSVPRYPADDLLAIMDADGRKSIDMREVIARIVDDSDFLDFKADFGPATVTGHASIEGQHVGIITNNGPIDPAGASKAAHFIQSCCQVGLPLLYLQNTTGYIVGKASETEGMIKHGSKMIQAVTTANVPQITLMCGASFGAGNYGMCGRGFEPRFLFSWPNAVTAVMGPQQAALTMGIVMEESARRRGQVLDESKVAEVKSRIMETFERQMSAFHCSGQLLDDGVIDPRDSRKAIAFVLSVCIEGDRRTPAPMQFGVARP